MRHDLRDGYVLRFVTSSYILLDSVARQWLNDDQVARFDYSAELGAGGRGPEHGRG